MKKALLIVALAIVSIATASAQYGTTEPREDYLQAFTRTGQNITWSRTVETSRTKTELIASATTHITVITITDNMVIGKIEDLYPGLNAPLSQMRLPWDSSTLKANVTYEVADGYYVVKVSNIMYQNDAFGPRYDSIYYTLYNKRGELRARADGDFRYFDNMFCDLLFL